MARAAVFAVGLVFSASLATAGCGGGGKVTGDAGVDASSGNDTGAAAGPLPFSPSNITLGGIDLSQIVDEHITASCEIRTAEGGGQDCFTRAADATVTQSDGSKVHVKVVRSLLVDPGAHVRLTVVGGSLPFALVSLGDFTLQGTIDAGASGISGGPGGPTADGNAKGGGTGGGAPATGVSLTPGASAGGGSYCGQGGQGVPEMGASGAAGAKAAAYGTRALVPLLPGSAGGGGDIAGGGGGGALQLVAGGAFTMGAMASVNVGGGGGPSGGTTGQEAGGGGSGGAILIEATTIAIAGTLAVNGGGGGGGALGAGNGNNGTADAVAAAGGTGALAGGAGSAGPTLDGATPATPAAAGAAPAGGGGAGRIRLNSMSGQATLTGATLSPAATTACVSQGTLAP